MSENKEFYVTIQGKKVFVSEEVYREYVRPIRVIELLGVLIFIANYFRGWNTEKMNKIGRKRLVAQLSHTLEGLENKGF